MLLLLLVLAISGLASSQEPQGPGYQEIGDGVYSFTSTGRLYFSMFVVTSSGVVVLDPMNTAHSREMLAAIREVTSLPVTHVMYSHNHWDHTGGAGVLGAENVVARDDAALWMEANPKPDGSVVKPNDVWSGAWRRMKIGGVIFDLKYIGINHGKGMTVFILPQQKIAFIADLVFPGSIAFGGMPDTSPRDLERSLREILAMDFTRAVFSHNLKPSGLEGGTKEDVQDFLTYHEDLRAAVNKLLKEGVQLFNIPDMVKLPKYENLLTYDLFIKSNVWAIVSEQLSGPFGDSGISESRLLKSLAPAGNGLGPKYKSAPAPEVGKDCRSSKWPGAAVSICRG